MNWQQAAEIFAGKHTSEEHPETDKDIRRLVHKSEGWFFASSRDHGPAHIIKHPREALCGTSYDTRSRVEAKNLCGNCRRIARTFIKDDELTPNENNDTIRQR